MVVGFPLETIARPAGSVLYVLGSSGHAREIAAYARLIQPSRMVVFVDPSCHEDGCIVISEYIQKVSGGGESVLGSGDMRVRTRMMEEIRPPFATIVHPAATVLGELLPGCVVAPGAVIAPNSRVGPHVLVNYGASVGHDAVVGELTVVGPGAAVGGWVNVGRQVYIGSGALIRERLEVGSGSFVAMGAVVTKSVPPSRLAVGVPARIRPLPDDHQESSA